MAHVEHNDEAAASATPADEHAPYAITINPGINEIAKTIVTTGLAEFPVVGNIISGLVGLFWPQQVTSVWDQVRKEVEAMIDEKIAEFKFILLRDDLDGRGRDLKGYLGVLKANQQRDLASVRTEFIVTHKAFVVAAPKYMTAEYEWAISPLFALFAQLHVSLLRDFVLYGKSWGFDKKDFDEYSSQAQTAMSDYQTHFTKVVSNQRAKLQRSAPTSLDGHRTNIHNYWQRFEEQRILLVDDFRVITKYLNPYDYPKPTTHIPFEDVYSRAFGTADNWDSTAASLSSNGVKGVYSTPYGTFGTISCEFFNGGPRRVNVKHQYGGPRVNGVGGVQEYGIIASTQAGVEKATYTFPKKVMAASVRVGSIPLALTLIMEGGQEVWMWDKGVIPGGQRYTVQVPGRFLSTLNMWTVSTFYDKNLGCIIFGFSVHSTPGIADWRRLYITSVGEPSDAVKSHVTIDTELDEERAAYWRYIVDQ